MKQYFGVGLGMLVGTLIGAAAVSGLHAQAKPPVYLITEIDVTDPTAQAQQQADRMWRIAHRCARTPLCITAKIAR
jgi:hypothetical protein